MLMVHRLMMLLPSLQSDAENIDEVCVMSKQLSPPPAGDYTLALIGNMNVGKTSIFNSISTGKAKPINIAGSSVTITRGNLKGVRGAVYDTPGNMSIFSANEDERITREIILEQQFNGGINGIILVADGKNLKRSLAMALQYSEFGLPVLLNINMADEASSRGIKIDRAKLAKILGVEVTQTIAPEGLGIKELVENIPKIRPVDFPISYTPSIDKLLDDIAQLIGRNRISPRGIGLMLLHKDRDARKYIIDNYGIETAEKINKLVDGYYEDNPTHSHTILTEHYNNLAEWITRQVQTSEPQSEYSWLMKFGDMCTSFSTGIPIACLVLLAMYFFIGEFGATLLVDAINTKLFEGILFPFVSHFTDQLSSEFLRDMIMDEDFGILPTGVFLAMGLVLPVIFCFYIAFGILEDSGYLPRISILLDNLFQKMGLNGKGVIPLVMGFSCVTMALLTTRILNSEKEKNIAAFLLYLCLPCAPLIAVMLIILEKMPLSATLVLFSIIGSQVLIAGYFANKILPGNRTPLILEIPPMRLPHPIAVVKMAGAKTYFFMLEALPIFILASLGVFLFERVGGLMLLEHTLGPMIHHVMGLPEKSVQVFIKTMIRRESGATELEHLRLIYTNLQLVVNLLVMTFVAPCINSFIVLFKERGIKVGLAINICVFVYAILLGSIVNHLCMALGVTFT